MATPQPGGGNDGDSQTSPRGADQSAPERVQANDHDSPMTIRPAALDGPFADQTMVEVQGHVTTLQRANAQGTGHPHHTLPKTGHPHP